MRAPFIGREAELAALEREFRLDRFMAAAILGGRGVGKTALANRFIARQPCRSVSFLALQRGQPQLLSMMAQAAVSSLAPELAGA
ncbi:MAG: ATP-binding protein, partial [Duodenibacillus sp.]|nr:ATP-binding protein [Duodenibacillus sp.]